MTLVPINERKEIMKKYEELWSKIRNLIRSIAKQSHDHDENYIKIKFDSDDDLPLNKTIKIHIATIVARAIFLENKNVIRKFF